MKPMQTYLVGGAVRDRLLGLPPGDRDFVVVGETRTRCRRAASSRSAAISRCSCIRRPARNTRWRAPSARSGRGHRGFVVDTDPSVTLEEDLQRRDFTINAIAEAADGSLVDPLGGARDIEAKRVAPCRPGLRRGPAAGVARGALHGAVRALGFSVAPETMQLMRAMVAVGELSELAPERVWQELARALASAAPSAFLRTLHDCGALAVVLPEVDALYGVPQRAEYHPEVDTGVHVELVCDMAARLAPGDAVIGFAALTHDLGKALTPEHVLPKHIGHESAGLAPLRGLCARLKVPVEHRQLAELACREHLNVHRLFELRDRTVHELLVRCDGFRQPARIAQLAMVCEADKRGRAGLDDVPIRKARNCCACTRRRWRCARPMSPAKACRVPRSAKPWRKARIAAIHAAPPVSRT